MSRHLCHAAGCTTGVPPKLFMCARHWRMVPKPMQRAIWREYRPGQEVEKNPSEAYLAAVLAARRVVARVERGSAVSA